MIGELPARPKLLEAGSRPGDHPGSGVPSCSRRATKPNAGDDIEFITRRASESKSARYQPATSGTVLGEVAHFDDWGCYRLPDERQPAAGGGSNA